MKLDPHAIKKALKEERRSNRPVTVYISDVTPTSIRTLATFYISDKSSRISDDIEGHSVYWETGVGKVLSADTSLKMVLVREIAGKLPSKGEKVSIKAPDFTAKLAEIWSNEDNYNTFYEPYDKMAEQNTTGTEELPNLSSDFPECNELQGRVVGLLKYNPAFLWGPPGTGKTTTIGKLIASVIAYTDLRVLLISNTNVAVDLSTISVVDALRKHDQHELISQCLRLGTRVDPVKYTTAKCESVVEPDTVRKGILHELEKHLHEEPSDDPELLEIWKKTEEGLRSKLQARAVDLLLAKRMTSMTATRGLLEWDALKEATFDVLVVDEAAQIGQHAVIPFLPLAKQWLFAGDHAQLEPICRQKTEEGKHWLGRSLFEIFIEESDDSEFSNRLMLEEQYRMANAICDADSQLFYDGRLRVADSVAQDSGWLEERRIIPCQFLGDKPLKCIPIKTEAAEGAEAAKGYHRRESAEQCVDAVLALRGNDVPQEDIAVVTVFNAQRRLITQLLKEACGENKDLVKGVTVSTVHSLQGGERPNIIFDPVAGNKSFVAKTLGERVINVALSRAKTRFICTLSHGDMGNRVLRDLAEHCGVTDLPAPAEVHSHRVEVLDSQPKTNGLLLKFRSKPANKSQKRRFQAILRALGEIVNFKQMPPDFYKFPCYWVEARTNAQHQLLSKFQTENIEHLWIEEPS